MHHKIICKPFLLIEKHNFVLKLNWYLHSNTIRNMEFQKEVIVLVLQHSFNKPRESFVPSNQTEQNLSQNLQILQCVTGTCHAFPLVIAFKLIATLPQKPTLPPYQTLCSIAMLHFENLKSSPTLGKFLPRNSVTSHLS